MKSIRKTLCLMLALTLCLTVIPGGITTAHAAGEGVAISTTDGKVTDIVGMPSSATNIQYLSDAVDMAAGANDPGNDTVALVEVQANRYANSAYTPLDAAYRADTPYYVTSITQYVFVGGVRKGAVAAGLDKTKLYLGYNATYYAKGLGVWAGLSDAKAASLGITADPVNYLVYRVPNGANHFYAVAGNNGNNTTKDAYPVRFELYGGNLAADGTIEYARLAYADVVAHRTAEFSVNVYGYEFIKLTHQGTGAGAQGDLNCVWGNASLMYVPFAPLMPSGITASETYDSGNGNTTVLFSGVSDMNIVSDYHSALLAAGYTLAQSNSAMGTGNYFGTYILGGDMIHCSYFGADDELRVTYGAATYLGDTEAVTGYANVVTPSVAMIGVSGTALSMVVQLADGSFVIIDGGFGQGNDTATQNADMTRLYDYLMEKKPAGTEKPQITWMITHADGDHIVLPSRFMKTYRNDVDVNMVCYNFPIYSSLNTNMNTFKNYANTYFPEAEHYIMHTGNKLYLPGCEIEFLFTASEDYYSSASTFTSGNHTSNAWRMTINGKTIFITGDIETGLCEKMVRNYGNYMASNILQVVHHGVNGATAAFNTCVASGNTEDGNALEVCFWPICSDRIWRTEEYPTINQPLWDSNATHYYHDYTTVIELPAN